MTKIYFKKLLDDAILPTRGSEQAAGLDLSTVEDTIIKAGDFAILPTGLACSIPANTYFRIAPRSGLAAKHQIDTMAGVIDSDYRGEIRVILINHGKEAVRFKKGDRIAQGILESCVLAEVEEVDSLVDTDRGANGFGSTGL